MTPKASSQASATMNQDIQQIPSKCIIANKHDKLWPKKTMSAIVVTNVATGQLYGKQPRKIADKVQNNETANWNTVSMMTNDEI